MAFDFQYTQPIETDDWSNYHGTIANQHIPYYLLPKGIADTLDDLPSSRRKARALQEILRFCFESSPAQPMRTTGATWSLSNIIQPKNVILDPAAFNSILRVNSAWFTQGYKARSVKTGNAPVVVESGTQIYWLNQKLGEVGLAIQTTGANDGHRIAGCIATGTHGSAISIGAVHDTVLAMYLVVAPDKAVLLQPATNTPFTSDLALWFGSQTGIPTESLIDDDLFAASMVGLGSTGFVHSVVMEAAPLYRLKSRILVRPLGDVDVWNAMQSLDTSPLHPDIHDKPYHFSVVLSPYAAAGKPGAFVTLMWKVGTGGVPFAGARPVASMVPSDTGAVVAKLANALDSPLTAPILEAVISAQTASLYKEGDIAPVFPGQAFGPTNIPAGNGTSTELVVDHKNTSNAIHTVLNVLNDQREKGRHLLGALGIRFVPQTRSLLGMNVHDMNTFIELPSLRNASIVPLYKLVWSALENAGIPFACHWGQLYGMSSASVESYYGNRVDRWKTARSKLLDNKTARTVFTAPMLYDLGMDG